LHEIPDSGTVTAINYPGVEGYPYVSLGILGILEEPREGGGSARLLAGVEWIPSKDIFGLLVGGGGIAGGIGNDALIEVSGEVRFLRLPSETVTVEHRQRQVVSIARRSSSSWQVRPTLRVGVEVLVWRRDPIE
jgi:hypothetical protein